MTQQVRICCGSCSPYIQSTNESGEGIHSRNYQTHQHYLRIWDGIAFDPTGTYLAVAHIAVHISQSTNEVGIHLRNCQTHQHYHGYWVMESHLTQQVRICGCMITVHISQSTNEVGIHSRNCQTHQHYLRVLGTDRI